MAKKEPIIIEGVSINGSMVTAISAFQAYKAKEDKRNKQMLWKCGARRFKFK